MTQFAPSETDHVHILQLFGVIGHECIVNRYIKMLISPVPNVVLPRPEGNRGQRASQLSLTSIHRDIVPSQSMLTDALTRDAVEMSRFDLAIILILEIIHLIIGTMEI